MSKIISDFDWAKTPLGPVEQWPQSLCTSVSILLHSKFPMFLWWGDDLIQFYNDAYRPSLGNEGKHPGAIGQRGEDCWQEIWPFIKPIIDRVRAGGEASWYEDQLLPIYRNGKLEDVYWTFSYSAVYDEGENIAGVFVTCIETTEKVQSIARLNLSEQRFQNLIREANLGIIVVSGEEMKVDIVNEAYGKLIALAPDDLLGYYRKNHCRSLSIIRQHSMLNTGYSGLAALSDGSGRQAVRYTMRDGKAIKIIGITINITEQKLFAEELAKQVQERTIELQRSNDDLLQFAHVTSHDLKEPIRKIKLFTNRIKSEYGGAMPDTGNVYR
jgi:PAS domain-containing protein